MQNSRHVVYFILVIFGKGFVLVVVNCCSCDSGKTKSTPSPKTEVWTLNLGLEFDKNY